MEKVCRKQMHVCLLSAMRPVSYTHLKTPLVEVAGEYLYKEDLQAALPFNISKDDSVLFAEHYIRCRRPSFC